MLELLADYWKWILGAAIAAYILVEGIRIEARKE